MPIADASAPPRCADRHRVDSRLGRYGARRQRSRTQSGSPSGRARARRSGDGPTAAAPSRGACASARRRAHRRPGRCASTRSRAASACCERGHRHGPGSRKTVPAATAYTGAYGAAGMSMPKWKLRCTSPKRGSAECAADRMRAIERAQRPAVGLPGDAAAAGSVRSAVDCGSATSALARGYARKRSPKHPRRGRDRR